MNLQSRVTDDDGLVCYERHTSADADYWVIGFGRWGSGRGITFWCAYSVDTGKSVRYEDEGEPFKYPTLASAAVAAARHARRNA